MAKKLFLPGAGGSARFWRPVIERLPADWDCHAFAWPGLGSEPHREDVAGVDDLVEMVLAQISTQADLVAQSMGGLVALKAALRSPDKVRRLVLAATSGGLPVETFGGADWRPGYREEFPRAASWITEVREDLSPYLSTVRVPTLLLWGDRDPVSPISVGAGLAEALPEAALHVVTGGHHDFPVTHPDEVAAFILGHLS